MTEQMFDVGALCRPEEREGAVRPWFVVRPTIMYPAMCDRIRENLAGSELPAELVDLQAHPAIDPRLAARRWRRAAQQVERIGEAMKVDPWGMPLAPTSDGRQVSELRTAALEVCRGWFTRALKTRVGPCGIHLLREDKFVVPDYRVNLKDIFG